VIALGLTAQLGFGVLGGAAPAATAAPALFVSPTGNDAGRCTQAAPCVSWDRAYQVSRPGDVIHVAGGTYGPQTIEWKGAYRNLSPGCTLAEPRNCVVFQPAGAITINGKLEIRGSSVWVRGTATPGTGIPSRDRRYSITIVGYVDTEADSEATHPDHVIVEGVDATSFGVFNVDTATFRNMDVGPATMTQDCRVMEGNGFENKIGFGGGITYVPRNVVIDGVLFHDQNRDVLGAESDCHFGGLFLVTADNLTIRNSVFSRNAVYNLQVQNFGGAPPPTRVTLENNWFGCPVGWLYDTPGPTRCNGQVDVQFNSAARFSRWLIRYNSFGGGLGEYVEGASYSDFRIIGNAGSSPSQCFAGWAFSYNAWDRRGCSRTDRDVGRLPFVSATPGSEDFRLVAGTRARAFVVPESPETDLARDMEGRIRPLNFPRDAGALERDTAYLALGKSIGSAVIGMPRAVLVERYGAPRKSRSTTIGPGKTKAQVESFAVPGGFLNATIVGDRVVGLATRSPFYSTPKGVGPSAAATEVPTVGWAACKNVLRRNIGGVMVSFQVSSGKKARVLELSMLRRAYDTPCPPGK
jgi:hypothetical protein